MIKMLQSLQMTVDNWYWICLYTKNYSISRYERT